MNQKQCCKYQTFQAPTIWFPITATYDTLELSLSDVFTEDKLRANCTVGLIVLFERC